MAILKIARMGHPVLGRRADEVDEPTAPEIRALLDDMLETMIDANGTGIAAPQVHVPWRVVIFSLPAVMLGDEPLGDDEDELHTVLTALINPEIEIVSDEVKAGWEGCLSVPGLRGLVPRPNQIRYRGLTPEGKVLEREAVGFHARVVQHECDHLDGVLYPQRMDDLSKLIFETEYRHIAEEERGKRAAAEEEA